MANQAQRIIERARRLPARERRRVVSALEASLAKSPKSIAISARRARSYQALLALAGTAHAEVVDVSTDKYAHLAAAYADDDA
jgi:dihydropteroate synthase